MNQMLAQIFSLPGLYSEILGEYDDVIRSTLTYEIIKKIKRIYITGCGDSYFAALGSQLAFHQFAGIPIQPLTSLHFARYEAGYLPDGESKSSLVIGISVSGEVSRTIEALNMGNQFCAQTIAITGTTDSPITQVADLTILAKIPDFPDPLGTHTPGVRSYLASQLALVLIATRIGELNSNLTISEGKRIYREMEDIGRIIDQTIMLCKDKTRILIEEWEDSDEFIFVGAGPNFATSLFTAAKFLEASGDSSAGQETEEWCHLQYFARNEKTPTIFLSAAGRDLSRTLEAVHASWTIGRRTAVIAPEKFSGIFGNIGYFLPSASVREVFSPMVLAIPGSLLAAYRAELIKENYFRGFGGGRDMAGGGGVSRIRTSDTWEIWQSD